MLLRHAIRVSCAAMPVHTRVHTCHAMPDIDAADAMPCHAAYTRMRRDAMILLLDTIFYASRFFRVVSPLIAAFVTPPPMSCLLLRRHVVDTPFFTPDAATPTMPLFRCHDYAADAAYAMMPRYRRFLRH